MVEIVIFGKDKRIRRVTVRIMCEYRSLMDRVKRYSTRVREETMNETHRGERKEKDNKEAALTRPGTKEASNAFKDQENLERKLNLEHLGPTSLIFFTLIIRMCVFKMFIKKKERRWKRRIGCI